MTNVFLSVLRISLSAGAVVLFLLLLTPLCNKRYGARWRYRIWVFLALWLVFPFETVGMLAGTVQRLYSEQVTDSRQAPENQTVLPGRIVIDIPQQMTAPIAEQREEGKAPVTFLDLAAAVWMAGSVIFLFVHFVSYLHYKRKLLKNSVSVWEASNSAAICKQLEALKMLLHIRRPVPARYSSEAASPMVIGFFHPVLVLPDEAYSGMDLYFILKHELIHFKRKDVWAKLLFMTANAVHWFHPLVWVMVREAVVDMELSCDERVIEGAKSEVRKAYTETLFSTIHKQCTKKTVLSTQFYGGARVMKKRFRNILIKSNKKNGILLFISIFVLTACVSQAVGCSVSNSKSNGQESTQEIFAKMAGIWQMEDLSAWGTGISYGSQMVIADNGEFSYYIGTGNGGTGQCEEKNGNVTVEITPYEGHSQEKELLALTYSEQGESDYILMDWHGTDVYWKRSLENKAEDNPESSDDKAAEQNTSGRAVMTVTKEGIEEQKPAYLAAGNGFSFYLPEGEWVQAGTGQWTSIRNKQVSIWVFSYHETNINQLAQLLADDGYTKQEGLFLKQEGGILTWAQPKESTASGEHKLWCVYYCCPTEAEEGFGRELAAIADTFAVSEAAGSNQTESSGQTAGSSQTGNSGQATGSSQTESSGQAAGSSQTESSGDEREVQEMVADFSECYFNGNTEGIPKYLADSFSGDIEIYSGINADLGGGTVSDFNLKGLESLQEPADVYHVSLEFKDSYMPDQFLYLSVDVVRQDGAWKIQWYGLEM